MLWKAELWQAADALIQHPLRIYIATPHLWTNLCNSDWGYAYNLERWFHKFLLQHASTVITQAADLADYVYVPHCAMNVYFSLKQSQHMRDGSADAPQSTFGANSKEGHGQSHRAHAPPAHGEDDVHRNVLHDVDSLYLVGEVSGIAQHDMAVSVCRSRSPGCRLLFVNMAFGRDDVPLFHEAVGHDAVFVTTAGAVPRMTAHEVPQLPKRNRGFSGCSCRRHCHPRHALGPLDVVVPFAISNNSTSGLTGKGGKRNLLALFAGSNTSCSRRQLFDKWASDATLYDHNILISSSPFDEKIFDRLARRSKFCLVLDGHWPATMRLSAVVAKGCVPLVISNRVELPFSDFIDWEMVSLRFNEGQIRELPQALAGIAVNDVQKMQGNLPLLAEALDYYHPRFHMLLLASLAVRRTSSKVGDGQSVLTRDQISSTLQTLLMDHVRFDVGSPALITMNARDIQQELHEIARFANPTLCNESAPGSDEKRSLLVLVMIMSPPHDFRWRTLVRRFRPELTQDMMALGHRTYIVTRFAVGVAPADSPMYEQAALEAKLSHELDLHGDLARLNISDGRKAQHSVDQHNGKVWHLFDWAVRHFPHADLIFKQDDDTIVNWRVALPRMLSHMLDSAGRILQTQRLYVGRLCPRRICCAMPRFER